MPTRSSAIVDDGVLYLKADEISAPHFEERGLGRFEYVKDGKVQKMGITSHRKRFSRTRKHRCTGDEWRSAALRSAAARR